MSNRLAFVLAIIVVLIVGVDVFLRDAEWTIFLTKKLLELTEWLAFWR